jgi:membrane protease YdiL (CAAX protease family)
VTVAAARVLVPSRLVVVAACTSAIIAAEGIGLVRGAQAAGIVDAFVAAVAISYAALAADAALRRLVAVLALLALSRTLSVVLPFRDLEPITWYAVVSIAVLAGAGSAARLFDDPVTSLRLRVTSSKLDLVVVLVGVPVGLVGHVLLRPGAIVEGGGAVGVLAEAVVLLGLAALAEELLFRGLMLAAARDLLGSTGAATAYVTAMTAAMYLGSGVLGYGALMVVLAAGLAAARWRGASLWGMAACRGLALMTMAVLVS